ncbi:MAG: hypothetical protein WA823_05770 [Candidatus Acidiferrales bacterium]
MNISRRTWIRFALIVACASVSLASPVGRAVAQEPMPNQQQPDNVQGTWEIEAKNWNGSFDTKSVQLKQDGNNLTGHFKGPNQSGGLEGTINIHHIVFRTKTRHPLTFRGRVTGDTIDGTFNIEGEKGEFHAVRTSPNP